MTKDLTVGSPMGLILNFGMPTLLGMLFQQFYNLMDTMIVGKLLGAQALAAVGSTSSINFFVIGFCMGVCSGFAIPVAQRMGAGDYARMRRHVANAAYLSILFATVLTVATGLLCRTILTVMNTPGDIFADAERYIFIIFMGIPTTFLYNLLAGILRSLGDSRTPVYFLALSSVLNIALDFAFILWFDAGVAGAAIATVVSQGISGAACLVFGGVPVLFLAFVSLGLAHAAWHAAVRRIGEEAASFYTYAAPLAALGVGVGLMGETMSWLGILGTVLVMAGVVVAHAGLVRVALALTKHG